MFTLVRYASLNEGGTAYNGVPLRLVNVLADTVEELDEDIKAHAALGQLVVPMLIEDPPDFLQGLAVMLRANVKMK